MHEATPGVFDRRYRLTTAGLLTLVTFIAFEAMAVGTAMPTAVRDLDGLAWYGWPFSAFLVASVFGMVVGGDTGDRRGPRAALLAGVTVFAAGLLAAGLAGSMALFVAARAVQGAGAGLIAVSLYVVAGQAYPAAARPRLFGAISAAWVLPALVGPLAAGLVTTHAGWRWVFLALLPLVAAGLALVLPALRTLRGPGEGSRVPAPARRWWAVLAGLGLALLQYAGQRRDGPALLVAAVGLAALAAGLRPLLPRGTVRARPGLPTVVASRGLLAGAFFGMDALLPLALTELHGAGPTAAGVPLTAGAVGWALASQLQGRRPGASRLVLLRAGFLLLATGTAATAVVAAPVSGAWPAYLTWAVAGLGMGLGMPSVGVLLLERSPEHRRGADSAAFQIADVAGSALAVGLVGVLVAAATAGVLPLAAAVVVATAVLAGLALLGAAVCGRAGGGGAEDDYPGGGGGRTAARVQDEAGAEPVDASEEGR
ncbi:Predicted arabinose efflux permease, MFS family [Geodermatophilus dictyosporus]|uniref:Predicted arabinose efflux permease, MFS family n=1 Tax=Geodermatophilus dictyosporus TaxID=1523247 RepID=A0A1I5KU84_9ACTN|nr:MFS transporter [Geodermatophilus dictyosporus]SFO88567.1 Predicted arabinose efflux permease, MFS family [Geodermatophilus dictyosporus]